MSQSRREALRRQQAVQAKAKRMQRTVLIGAIVAALVVVGVFGAVLFSQWQQGSSGANSAVPVHATPNREGIVVNPGKAAAGAPVVGLYIDYQCPVCKQFESAFGPTINDMAAKGEIQLEYRTMTFLDNNLRNDSSLKAGIAAACADNAGSYSAFHDAVFAGQPATEGDGYTTEQLRVEFPTTAGISGQALSTFQQCYDTRATGDFVRGTNEAAAKAGINATPSLVVNGKKIENNTLPSSNPEAIRQLILSAR